MTHPKAGRFADAFSPDDEQRLKELRRKRASKHHQPPLTAGQKVADSVAASMGSWRFLIIQTIILAVWILLNVFGGRSPWDPYPFILLNLVLSFQAAYSAPLIMMSQNRQSEIDRARSVDDYDVNVKAELEIALLHQKIDLLREKEIGQLLQMLSDLQGRLAAAQAEADRLRTGGSSPANL